MGKEVAVLSADGTRGGPDFSQAGILLPRSPYAFKPLTKLNAAVDSCSLRALQAELVARGMPAEPNLKAAQLLVKAVGIRQW